LWGTAEGNSEGDEMAMCVCGTGVGSNSIQCTSCQKWVNRKCSGIKGRMYKVMKMFVEVA